MAWFRHLFGFPEHSYTDTRARLDFDEERGVLNSTANGRPFPRPALPRAVAGRPARARPGPVGDQQWRIHV